MRIYERLKNILISLVMYIIHENLTNQNIFSLLTHPTLKWHRWKILCTKTYDSCPSLWKHPPGNNTITCQNMWLMTESSSVIFFSTWLPCLVYSVTVIFRGGMFQVWQLWVTYLRVFHYSMVTSQSGTCHTWLKWITYSRVWYRSTGTSFNVDISRFIRRVKRTTCSGVQNCSLNNFTGLFGSIQRQWKHWIQW